MFVLDPKIDQFSLSAYDTPLIEHVWKRYFWENEKTPNEAYRRVAAAIASVENEVDKSVVEEIFYEMMSKRLFLPGGRILAGAGTAKRVTLMNCFVNRTIEDSMEGIEAAFGDLLFTMQQGGGMGNSFETIRPRNAILKRTQSAASGPLPFMDMWNGGCQTIRSAGDRRGAMMGTMSDTHPDVLDYIEAKAKGSKLEDGTPLPENLRRWNNFNVSVLVSDALMAAVEENEKWSLFFHVPFIGFDRKVHKTFIDDNGVEQFVYKELNARDLFDAITKNTYEYSDPGVIFIDRINRRNNLAYCELIRATNPCGEQPLPPNACCNLGAINVAQCVIDPFTPTARINWDLLESVIPYAVRFLDNVIDVTGYPLKAQEEEEFAKRRIGLGITGLGTMLAELMIPYGSLQSVQTANRLMKHIAIAAYRASSNLAFERSCFPLFDRKKMLEQEEAFVCTQMPLEIQNLILEQGLRNGVILTIAPVGTGSIALGNISSGLEPDFMHEYERRVRKNNADDWHVYTEKSYTKRFYEFCTNREDTPEWMTTADKLTVEEHIQIQAALQEWVDASVSKTINVPEDISYDDFVNVYRLAYNSGCKGCTTYRPTSARMSILGQKSSDTKNNVAVLEAAERGEELDGTTYKIKWPSMSASMYVTINYKDNRPHEIFFASKDAKFADWMTGLTLMISAIFRSNIDPSFIPSELKQVISASDTSWHNGKFVGSLVARIGQIIEQDFIRKGIISSKSVAFGSLSDVGARPIAETKAPTMMRGTSCPSCGQPTLLHIEGCKKCTNCGYSAC